MTEVVEFFDTACGLIWSILGFMFGLVLLKAAFDVLIITFTNKNKRS